MREVYIEDGVVRTFDPKPPPLPVGAVLMWCGTVAGVSRLIVYASDDAILFLRTNYGPWGQPTRLTFPAPERAVAVWAVDDDQRDVVRLDVALRKGSIFGIHAEGRDPSVTYYLV